MADVTEHPALDRLQRLERQERRPRAPERGRPSGPVKMGYQPTLDGVRAVSVIAVMLYHAGFSWAHGGFFGVEVFFVVSGFLITSLLIEEHDGSGKVGLGQFYLRRARRLLPALFTVLIVVGVWAVFWGSTEQQVALRRDYPWGIGYVANWGAIFSEGSYWGAGAPKLLRHLWSLAVEEQWYLLWPLTFIAIRKVGRSGARADERIAARLAGVSVAVMIGTSLAQAFGWVSSNALYLSTVTRSSGLLLGAAMAFVWRPWRRVGKRPAQGSGPPLGPAAVVALLVLAAMVVVGRVEYSTTYLWQLPLVTIASAVLVAVVVHPWATGPRAIFGWQPLVEVGKRSYGLYLWSWPISAMVGADEGSFSKFVLAMAITIPVSEACYRLIEAPIRRGALGRWWKTRQRPDWNRITVQGAVAAVALVVPLTLFFADRPAVFDPAADAGNSDVVFDPNAAAGVDPTTTPSAEASVPASEVAVSDPATSTTAAAPVTTAASLPRRVVIVGDSTAHSLAINLPSGIESTFTIGDGSVEGCSVYDSGKGVSTRPYTRTFDGCAGWSDKWVAAAQSVNAEVALVVLGAWDVFDVQTADGQTLVFGTPANDQRFIAGVQEGIDKLSAIGVKVALLEIPCMRPQDVQGAGVPALPERGDDARVAHLNDLLRQVAAANPATTTFVNGPAEYCADPAIAADLAYRWDGVHAYKPGAKLTFEAAAAQLLAIPV